jgi:hypothetical protein
MLPARRLYEGQTEVVQMVATRDDVGVGKGACRKECRNRRSLLRCSVLDRYFSPARPVHVASGVNPRVHTDRAAEQVGQGGCLLIESKRGDLRHILNSSNGQEIGAWCQARIAVPPLLFDVPANRIVGTGSEVDAIAASVPGRNDRVHPGREDYLQRGACVLRGKNVAGDVPSALHVGDERTIQLDHREL